MYPGKGYAISSLIFLLLLPFSNSVDTITATQPLRDGDILVSAGETFALGFFSPSNSTTNRYVGVWYHRLSKQTVVWIANRDDPINGTSGVLSLDPNSGNLVLRDQNRSVLIWYANVSSAVTASSVAQLFNSGNFVLFGDGDSRRDVLWQSFDYPTDTMLPNLRLGLDRRTGLNKFLTSWRSPEDPGSGDCTYRMDVRGRPQMFLSRNSTRIWRSGPWIGLGWSGVQMTPTVFFNATFVDNQDDVTITFGLYNASMLSKVTVSQTGTIERQTWLDGEEKWVGFYSAPKDQCDNYGHCGVFGYCDPVNNENGFECTCLPGYEPRSRNDWYLRDGTKGCVRKRAGQECGNGAGFVTVTSVKLPDTSTNSTRVDRNLGPQACEELCARNCTCAGYASVDIREGGGSGCITWYGEMNDTRHMANGQDVHIRVDAIELAEYSRKSKSSPGKRKVAIVVPTVAAVFVILSLAYWLMMKKKKRDKIDISAEASLELCSRTGSRGRHEPLLFSSNSNSASWEGTPSGNQVGESGTNTDLPFFSLSTLVAATDSFAFQNKLGEGGFGSVYKGELRNGQEIAVKKLSNNSGQGVDEFKNEVTLIAKLQHRNLVRLLGYCIHQEEKMLIYEYMPNKGLDNFIFDKEKGPSLSWSKRFEITLGIARGMLYLHQDSRLRIIHRDLKANNVLLDAAMTPKISDFGMARIFGGEQMEATTNRVVGTYGYMSPEYAMEGLFSIKSDVFSFGVLLLEIISGRKNNSFYKENSVNLIGYVWELWIEGKALEIIDPSLGESYQAQEVLRCIHVGLLCVQEFANDRPTMSEVAFMLGHETTLPSPKQPAFILKNGNFGPDTTFSSINDTTITVVEAR